MFTLGLRWSPALSVSSFIPPSWCSCQASVFLVLSHLNKNLKQWLEPSEYHSSQTDCVIALGSQTDHVIALRQINVTAQFYLENSRKIHPRGVRTCQPKDTKAREGSPFPLAPLFMCFFPCPPGPALYKLGQPGVLFVLPEVLTSVLWPSFVLFSWAFPFLVF